MLKLSYSPQNRATASLFAFLVCLGIVPVYGGTIIIGGDPPIDPPTPSVTIQTASGTTRSYITSGTYVKSTEEDWSNASIHVTNSITLYIPSEVTYTGTAPSVSLAAGNASYLKSFKEGEAFSLFGTVTSKSDTLVVWDSNTSLQILAGVALHDLDIEASFRGDSDTALNSSQRHGYILSIEGMGDSVFVMQLSYKILNFFPETPLDETQLRLGYLSGNEWVPAADGPLIYGTWNGSLDVGTHGVDTENDVVWAVIDHNSDFAVIIVPEPSTLGLLILSFVGLALLVFRRCRCALGCTIES